MMTNLNICNFHNNFITNLYIMAKLMIIIIYVVYSSACSAHNLNMWVVGPLVRSVHVDGS